MLKIKKWNPYCIRHSAITACSDYLPEYAIKKQVMYITTLYDIGIKDHIINTTVRRTATVSVMVVCSDNAIPIDILGLAKLTSGLTRVEEWLQRVMSDSHSLNLASNNSVHNPTNIPNHMSWIVTM